jgi:hypothetical protein
MEAACEAACAADDGDATRVAAALRQAVAD